LHAGPAAAGRSLRQYTDTRTGQAIDKSRMVLSNTIWASTLSITSSRTVANDATTKRAVAATTTDGKLPGSTIAATFDYQLERGDVEPSGAAFRASSVSMTDTEKAYASSQPDGMPLALPDTYKNGRPIAGVSTGSTLAGFDPNPVVPARANDVRQHGTPSVASIGLPLPASRSFAISDNGDGPHAMSTANEAVATSWSSSDFDYEAASHAVPDARPDPPEPLQYDKDWRR
jgi:hypothetical protein